MYLLLLVGLSHLKFVKNVNLLLWHEGQPESPPIEGAEHLGELMKREVASVHRHKRLCRVMFVVTHELTAKDGAPRRPLVGPFMVIHLGRTNRNFGQDVVLSNELV